MIIKGKILVSVPLHHQPNKQNFVILIYKHDDFGALGVNLNYVLPQEFLLHLMDTLEVPYYDPNPTARIHYGGMHDLNQGLILHTNDYQSSSSIKINDEISLTNSVNLLKRVAANEGPKKSLIVLGHTRFLAGQIENELYEHRWLIMEPLMDVIFTDHVWQGALVIKGINPTQFQIHEHVGNA